MRLFFKYCNAGAFTHTSYNDFEIVAANLFDDDPRRISDRIPTYGLFIDPPLGRIGMTEKEARESGRPILLIAHSMGSVIAYDSLWEMTHGTRDHARIDRLLTMGSPLGQNYLQKRLFGHDQTGKARYPDNIRRWTNLEAVGDLTAIDRVFRQREREACTGWHCPSRDRRSAWWSTGPCSRRRRRRSNRRPPWPRKR